MVTMDQQTHQNNDAYLKEIAIMCCDAAEYLKTKYNVSLVDALVLSGKYTLISALPDCTGEISIRSVTNSDHCALCKIHKDENGHCSELCVLKSEDNDGYCLEDYRNVRTAAEHKDYMGTAYNIKKYIKSLMKKYVENEL